MILLILKVKFILFFPKYAHHFITDRTEVIVDYGSRQLMPEWIPRRVGMFPAEV